MTLKNQNKVVIDQDRVKSSLYYPINLINHFGVYRRDAWMSIYRVNNSVPQ